MGPAPRRGRGQAGAGRGSGGRPRTGGSGGAGGGQGRGRDADGSRRAGPGRPGSAPARRAGPGRPGSAPARRAGRSPGRPGGGSGQGSGTQGLGGDQVEGRQAVRELLRAGRRPVRSLYMAEGMDAAAILDEIEALATAHRVRVDYVSHRRIDALARTDAAQGVVAIARPVEEASLESLCEPSSRGRVPFLLVLDGITDPHNLGALLRSAECAGVTGVVLPRHRSAHLSPSAAKAAAGAVEYLPMTLVAGIPAALVRLSAQGVWTVGLVGDARQSLYELALGDQPVALVLGSEGTGLAALTRKRCDALVSIPQHGSLSSLNVSTAGAIACFDVARQRSH